MIRRYTIADAGSLTKLIRRYWDDVSDDSYSMDGLGEHIYQVCTRPDVFAIGGNAGSADAPLDAIRRFAPDHEEAEPAQP